jgi:hypothetical protein
LNAITALKIARPGNVPIHQYWKYCVPTATIDPHSGSGGCAPRPRNESPARSRIAFARSSVASTTTGPATFGRMSRTSARRDDEPSSRDAWTNSESPSESTSPRTTRAYAGQATITMASTAFRMFGPSDAVTTIARMIAGKAKTRSVLRMTTGSTQERK